MSYKLTPPYTEDQRADFIVSFNYEKGLQIEETKLGLFALEEDEIIENDKPVKNPNYTKEKRLQEIRAELIKIESEYNEFLETPLTYKNEHLYKVIWAQDSYADLILAGQIQPELFPLPIYDSTHLEENKVIMTLQELIELSTFLISEQQKAYSKYSLKRSELLKEQTELIN